MSQGYNPYRQQSTGNSNNILDNINQPGNSFFNNRLARLSRFGRTYSENAIKNAKGIHANEDLSVISDAKGYDYSMFSRKVHAMMSDKQTIAALSQDYLAKIMILQEYASKVEIRDFVSKMANEIIVYGKDKKFCELTDLPVNYSESIREKAKSIFEDVYQKLGFNNGSAGWDICRDWLVEGFICREIIYDSKGKNIEGFQKLDHTTIIPIVDIQSGLKIWVQHPYSEQNRRILLDAEIIYISYSGASNYMETSYIEPLIRPYNELKSIERARLLFNLINATMHKEFVIPTTGLSPMKAEEEITALIADYKDHVSFDDTTGLIYIDGSKDLPYSKEYWFPNPGDGNKPEMNIIDPSGHDLNENSMLIWFRNNMKRASKFPLSRLDTDSGGGNLFSTGGDVTHDDYNFTQYVERLRALYKEILIKPVTNQLLLDFPELDKETKLINDLDITYYGHSEIIEAKALSNLQAKAAIAADLTNNLKRDDDKPLLHWKFIAKHIMKFTDEEMLENDNYYKESDSTAGEQTDGGAQGGGEAGGEPTGEEGFEEGDVLPEEGEAPTGEEEAPTEEAPEEPLPEE